MTAVALLLVSFRSAEEVAGLLESLAGAAPATDVDVYVVENSDDPEAAERVAALPGIHRFVRNERNSGYGGGMNLLARQLDAEYDWLLVCNPDLRFSPGSIDEMLRVAGGIPDSGIFGPKVLTSEGGMYPSARAFPSIRSGVGHALFGGIWPSNPWTRRYHRPQSPDATDPQRVDWLSGACLLVRRNAWEQVGGFDEGYFMYFEDVDLAQRLHAAGWNATWIPSAVITHSGAHSTGNSAFMRKVHHESARRYLDRKYRGPLLAPLRWALRLGLRLRSGMVRR